MELVLYVADENGQISLGDLVPPGTHYQAARNENTGVVRLTPVKVNTTTPKSAPAIADPQDEPPFQG